MRFLLLLLFTVATTEARRLHSLSEPEMLRQSDLVVIATPGTTTMTSERVKGGHDFARNDFVIEAGGDLDLQGVETSFQVEAVLKGNTDLQTFVLHYYRLLPFEGVRGEPPVLPYFPPKPFDKYLLYLRCAPDGRYEAVTGQVDSALSIYCLTLPLTPDLPVKP